MSSVQPPSFGGFNAGTPFSGGGVLISSDAATPLFGGRRSSSGRLVPGDIVEISSDVFSTPYFTARRPTTGGSSSGEIQLGGRRSSFGDLFAGDGQKAYLVGGGRRDPFSGEVFSTFCPVDGSGIFGPFSGEVFPPGYYDAVCCLTCGTVRCLRCGAVRCLSCGRLVSLEISIPEPFSESSDYSSESETDVTLSGRSSKAAKSSKASKSKADWMETPTQHVFMVEVPGLSKGDVKVEVEKAKFLKISAEMKREAKEKNQTWHASERSTGKLKRKFKLYGNPMVDEIQAKVENGVLTVVVPKGTPDVKAVQVSE